MVLINLPFVGVLCPAIQSPFGDTGELRRKRMYIHRNNLHHQTSICTPSREVPANSLDSWYTLAKEYSQRRFTFKQYTLPAISGLAKWHATRLSDQYVAGLWVSDLGHGLLWTTESSDHPSSSVGGGCQRITLSFWSV
ncbi:hypothetical protein QBC38DRAFT_487361 [Podospora fimiseda]|uniref:Uncharacterized protein n=1 Tax=Podospora fimiseda TaxID=252190 RepID=A0AAN7BHQ8_9PEZI|nr:hypothetical protein QBC38DRAFT_487361 [Podospora fimiseda]